MSTKCYRVVTVNGLAGSVRFLLVELAEDGATETLLPLSFATIEEAETARSVLSVDEAETPADDRDRQS